MWARKPAMTAITCVASVTPVPEAVIVTGYEPAASAADALTVNVAVVAVVDVGLTEAVIPLGAPLTASVTLPAKFVRTRVRALVALLPPATTETVAGVALIAMELAAGAVTVSAICAVPDAAPLPAPCITTVYVPGVVAAVAVNETSTEFVSVGPAGLLVVVTPVGTPD